VTVLVSYEAETGTANRWYQEASGKKPIRTHTAEVLPPEEWTDAAIPLDMLLRIFRHSPSPEHQIGTHAYEAAVK
jgi:hypothetical protein